MSTGKFKWRKRISVLLLPMFIWLGGCATAGLELPTLPPDRALKWDISRKDSTVKQEFLVKECKAYELHIGFGGTDATYEDGRLRRDSNQSWRDQLGTGPNHSGNGPLRRFLGDGSYAYYRKDGSDPNPVRARTPDEVQERQERFLQGEYVTKLGNPGVVVPVRIVVEKLDDQGKATFITDQTVDTGGISAGGHLIFRRIAWGIRMKQGIHRVTATVLRDSPLPEGIGTYLVISRRPWTTAPKDCD